MVFWNGIPLFAPTTLKHVRREYEIGGNKILNKK